MGTRLRILAVAGLPALLAGTACSGGRDALTIYSGRDEALVAPLLEDFVEETGIDVDIRYGDSGDLALLLEEEGDATPADVFLSQSPGPTTLVAEENGLAELDGDVLDLVDERWRGDGGRWVGVTARQRVLVYNTEIVSEDELPESVFDLVEPEYEGEVALAPTNASFQDFVTAMRQMEGEDAAREWLEGMVVNGSPTYADNSSIVAAVGRGEIPMGLVNHYYNHRALEEDPSLPSRNYVFRGGDLGSLLIDSTVGVIATTDQRESAERFVEFLLGEQAQEFFARETFEYPLASGAAAPEELPPLEDASGPAVDLTTLGDLEATARMIADSGLL
ncbi:MAG: iron ABC transporter substrate-binding protein [Actinomycetota bacterium]|nr:iron ABC transporter substrate-binding protein [Actinomycetota bacterium]